jgi:hypothetical protein
MTSLAQGGEKGIIILGMHRSGTSLIAELVYRWGAYTVEEKLLPATSMNPRGFWEHSPLLQFNNELLDVIGSPWPAPLVRRDKVALAGLSSEPYYRDKAQALLSEMRGGGRPWFWKDPKLVVLLPFWKRLWGEVIYVVPIRNPVDIAISYQTWWSYPISASLLVWQEYMSSILRHDEVAQEALFIDYDELIENQMRECQRLCRYLNDKFELSLKRIEEQTKFMAGAVDPSLRRSRNNGRMDFTSFATQAQRDLYQAIGRRLRDHGSIVNGDFDLNPGDREYLITLVVLRQLMQLMDSDKLLNYVSSMPDTFLEIFGLGSPTGADEETWRNLPAGDKHIMNLLYLLNSRVKKMGETSFS